MVVKCEIKFDNNPNGIYFAGQTLSGIVELTLNKSKKLRGLILKIEGCAKVEWSETESRGENENLITNSSNNVTNKKQQKNPKVTVKFSGREDYMNTTTYLIGGPNGNQLEIAPGSYQYNFTSVLPPMLPTSFEAENGSIRYLINVIIDRPNKSDLNFKSGFTVLKHLNLNYENPALKIPSKLETQKSFYCGLCRTNPLYVSASIPMSGYVSGQSILVSIQVNNQSSIDVDQLKVSLMKIIFYNSQVPEKRTKQEFVSIVDVNCGKIQKKCATKFDQRLNIPALPPSNTNYCRILNVSYEVYVSAKMSGFQSIPPIKIPITIGTIPFNNIPQQSVEPSAPTFATLSDPLPQNSLKMEIPPPSYQQATDQQQQIQLTDGNENSIQTGVYHPMYPVYNFTTNNQQPQIQLNSPSFVVN